MKTTPIQNHWKRLKASNSWIFSITSKVSGHLICSGKSNAITLSGNGLLEFNKACVLQLPDIVIKGRIEFETKITSSFIPSANVSSWIIKQDAITTTPKLPIEVHIDPSEFDNMKRKIEDVIAQSKDLPAPTDLNSHDYHHYGISAFLFAGMIGILITLRYRTNRPTPKPRRSASRFEVNV